MKNKMMHKSSKKCLLAIGFWTAVALAPTAQIGSATAAAVAR